MKISEGSSTGISTAISPIIRTKLRSSFVGYISSNLSKQISYPYPIRMDIGTPEEPPPKVVIDKLKEAQDKSGFHTYSYNKGESFFLDAIAQYIKERFGVNIDPNKEVTGTPGGANAAMFFLLREIVDNGIVMLPSPGYPFYFSSAGLGEKEICEIPLTPKNKFKPDLKQVLEEYRKRTGSISNLKAVILNYPQNPTGAVSDLDYYRNVVKFAKEQGSLIINDNSFAEIYSPRYTPPQSILQVDGAKDIAIELYSLSKTLRMTGDRVAFAVGNEEVIDLLQHLNLYINIGNIPKAIQYAAAVGLTDNSVRRFIDHNNLEYMERKDLLSAGLEDLGWNDSRNDISRATFFVWNKLPEIDKRSLDFGNELYERAGILTIPGSFFGSTGETFLRMSVLESKDKIAEAIDRLRKSGFIYH